MKRGYLCLNPLPHVFKRQVRYLLSSGYFDGKKIENAQDLTALLQTQTLPKETWMQIGRLIRKLHDLQICHTDLNAHNILLQQTEQGQKCWLLDFDKCGEKNLQILKVQNLNRLKRSFEKKLDE